MRQKESLGIYGGMVVTNYCRGKARECEEVGIRNLDRWSEKIKSGNERRERCGRRGKLCCSAIGEVQECIGVISAAASLANENVYVPPDVPEWKIYVGFLGGLAPFVIAAFEFGKRIVRIETRL